MSSIYLDNKCIIIHLLSTNIIALILSNKFCRVNGASVPTIPFKPDFSEPKGEVMLLYQNLLDAIGIGRENTQMDLTPEDFCANLPLFAIDLSGDGCNNYKIHLGTSGTLNINASLKKPTDKVWQLVKFLTYPKCLTIDKDRICKVEDLF